MKTKFYLGMAMLALLMANCAQEENVPALENDYSIISASIESAAKTRSLVTEGGEFSWTDGDKISVQKQNGEFATYIYGNDSKFALDSQEEPPATLSGVAYYPANENHTSAVFILPAEYNLEDNTKNTNAPMIASVEEGTTDFSFKHMGGVLRFIFRNVPAEANKFVFTTTDKAIAGEFNVVTESDGTQVIKTVDASSSNNTITINFTEGQSAEMTFYVPMPIGTYTGMSVKFYNGENELWSTSTTATNTIGRASLLLMPTLTCTANVSTASTSDAVNSALSVEGKPEASVNLTGEATNEDISIPESFTEAATEESNLNLTYNDVPTANEAITISDANPSAEQSDSKGNVNISIPNVANESEAPSFNINLPTMTVTLQANVENAAYNEVTASTAKNTLRIAKGVTIKKLILNGGNIVIENGATVKKVENANNFNEKTIIVNKGTLTNSLPENVEVVDKEFELRVLTFEDEDARFDSYYLEYADQTIEKWSDLIDEQQHSGVLLYGPSGAFAGTYEGDEGIYHWYDQGNTELMHEFPYTWGGYSYYGGGHAISNYASEDFETYGDAFGGQLTVFGTGGHSGSNFCMHFGYIDYQEYVDQLPALYMGDNIPRVIDHMYVNVTTYVLNCLLNGNSLTAPAGDNDTFFITATGYDKDDNITGTVTKYIWNPAEDEYVLEWTKWDLTPLGKVLYVKFNVGGTNDNGYGFSQPAYFAYDDVAVRFEK